MPAVPATFTPAQSASFAMYQRVSNALGITDYASELIHYTSLDALRGILSTHELWFGKTTDLNDTAECDHFLDALLEQAPSLMGINASQLLPLFEPLRGAVRTRTFVSSWCEHDSRQADGRLTMWHPYAQEGHGVALVIDSAQLQPSVMTPAKIGFHVVYAKIDYVPREQVADHANDMLKRLASVGFAQSPFPEKLMMAMFLLVKAPCVKHEGFSDEQEMRFMCLHGLATLLQQPIPANSIRRAGEREFFALDLRKYPQFGFDLRVSQLLKKVIVGPAGDKQKRASEVRALLDSHGLQAVEVSVSGIPLR